MTKFLNNADIKGYIAQTAVTSYLLKADSTGRLVAAIAGTDYQAPTTALLPSGGTAGQILAKIDGTNYNAQWIDNFAQQIKYDVKLGAALSKGTPVYVSSANGTNIIVSASSNATEATSSKTLGLLETGGALNDIVKVVSDGLLSGLNTSAATIGDPVWLGVNGALIFGLANKPSAPAHLVYIGAVTRVHATNGEIFIKVQNGFELDELHNVALSSVADGQGLFYESATSLWKNKTIASVLGYTPANGANYLPLTGGTISGDLTISSTNPRLYFTDTDNNPDYFISNTDGTFTVYDVTNSVGRFKIYSGGNAEFTNNLTAASATFSSLTSGYVTRATTGGLLTNSLIYDNASNVIINATGTIGFGAVKLLVKQSTNSDYEGINVQSVANSDVVAIAHTGTIGRISTTYGSGGTGTYTDLAFATSGTDRLYITTGGNVGINTTSPGSLPSGGGGIFSVYQSTAASLWLGGNTLSLDGQGTARDLYFYFRWSSSAIFQTDSYYKFLINSTEIVRLQATGQLRLNTYTSATSYTGTAAGYLAFDSSGNVITVAGVAATDNTKLPFNGVSTRFNGDVNTLGLSGTTGVYNLGGTLTNSPSTYGTLLGFWNTDISTQLYLSYNGNAYWRPSASNTFVGATWRTFLDSSNYNSYSPTLTGGGASGSWGISVTGSAGSVAWSGVTGKPTTLSGYGITDGLYTTTSDFTTAGAGWYRVATTGGDGRGYYYVEVYTTGGNHNPSYLRIEAMGDWGSDKLIAAYTDTGFPANNVRITRSASNTFLEVYFTTTILGASMRVTRLGFNSATTPYSGSLPGGGDTVKESLSITSKLNSYSNSSSVFRFNNSSNNAYLTGNSDWGFRVVNDSGYIQFGPANPSWAHIYSGLPFYFNQNLFVNGTQVVTNSGTWGINISGNSITTSQTNFSNLTIGGAQVWYNSGSWLGDLASYGFTRAWGLSMSGGSEFVLLYKNGQGYTLVDGSYYAYEGGGFYSSSNSAGNTLLGFYADTTSSVNFNTSTVKANGNLVWHASNAPRAGNSNLMYYAGFTLDANTMPSNSTGFTYANNAPYTGPIAKFSEDGYPLQLNATYSGGTSIAYRTRNGDAGSWNSWYAFITTANIGSQSVSYASSAGAVAWSNVSSKPAGWLDTTNLISDNTPGDTVNWVPSGFYQNYAGAGNPTGTWFNYINVRHSNPGNAHGFQLGMSYYDNNLWFRSYQGSGSAQSWARALSSQNYNSYSPTLTGGGASGTWGINITGNANNITQYTINQSLGTGNGPTFATIYINDWARIRYESGVYFESYDAGLRSAYQASFGQVATYGTARSGHGGYIIVNNYITNLMQDTSGNFGFFSNNDWAWRLFYNRGNNCWGIGTDNTYSGDGFRCIKYGSAEYGWTTWSDRRAKENISTINGALDKVLGMRGVYYNYIKDETKSQHVGFIAQELMEILPQSVRYAEEIDEYNINYGPIVSVLSEAIKEQNIEIQSLKAQLQTLLN